MRRGPAKSLDSDWVSLASIAQQNERFDMKTRAITCHRKGLIIDDDPSFCHLIVHAARKQGIALDYVTSVLELDAKDSSPEAYDFVLLDYNLGAVDGLEVATTLAGQLGDIPYILVSACAIPVASLRTLPTRVVGCLSKAAGIKDILKFVVQVTGGNHAPSAS